MKIKNKREFILLLLLILISMGLLLAIDYTLAARSDTKLIETEGQMRLSSIAGQVNSSLYRSECLLDSLVMQTGQIISEEGSTEAMLERFFGETTERSFSEKSDGHCFAAYAVYNGKLYINGFIPDDSYILDERSWYVGAKKRMGAIYVTDPYIDASTGKLCYSVAKMLPDKETVVGLDFNMDEIQNFVEKMSSGGSEQSLIVSDKGMIVGHSESELVGKNYRESDFLNELVNKVYMLYGQSFKYTSGGKSYSIFSDKTNYGWYLIVCMDETFALMQSEGRPHYVRVFDLILVIAVTVIFIMVFIRKEKAESELEEKEGFIGRIKSDLLVREEKLRDVSELMASGNLADESVCAEINSSRKALKSLLDSLSVPDVGKRAAAVTEKTEKKHLLNYKRQHFIIVIVLLLTSVFAIFLNTRTHINWGSTKMRKETEIYYYQVQEWIAGNRSVLNVISDSIAAQPDFASDYEKSVEYLNDIVSQYDDISVAYLCNPEWEHTVIMNNYWEPDDDWHVEQRQWYIDTLASDTNFNISAPYIDEQTGLYCTTLSKIVYDSSGNFIGLLGIDYYLDKLVSILGASYTDVGYAFLTDVDGNILNHPYEEYQMKTGSSHNAAELCYRASIAVDEPVIIDDYDGYKKVCFSMEEQLSGFTVIAVKNLSEIYSELFISDILYTLVFAGCIAAVVITMNIISKWQDNVNRELKEAADKAISAGKAKNKFLAQMSHEIRTPINAVLGMNEMILRESKEENILRYASNAYNSGNALLSIINDILDISKIEAGKLEIVETDYDLFSLVNDCYHMTVNRAEKKGLTFSVECDEALPSRLKGDMFHIRQIVVNFITNAIKYTDEGSVRLSVSGVENDGVFSLRFAVKDTGMGLKPESLEKLFTSFQRFDLERNQSVEGTGLGLSICKQLAELMGGSVKAESVYNAGSTFTCTIPQKITDSAPVGELHLDRSAEKIEVGENSSFTAPDARILVVDDVEMNLFVFTSFLKGHGMRIDTALSGKKSLELVSVNSYDIIFMDHMMPEMDGIETFRNMRANELISPGTPVIMLTANAISGEEEKYLSEGFESYLTKPIQSAKLENMILKYLPKEKVIFGSEPVKHGETPQSDEEASELFDMNVGIGYNGGRETYIEVLKMYVKSGEEKLELIKRLEENEEWKDYITEVHALKSTSLMIGSKQLSEAAKELELAGKAGSYGLIKEKNGSLLELYDTVISLGKELLGRETAQSGITEEKPDAGSLTEISAEKLKEFVRQITEACEGFDCDKAAAICEEAEMYSFGGTPLKPLLAEVKSAADDFEYDSAAEKAREILEKSGIA